MDMLLNEDHALLFRSRSIIRLISEQKEISHCSARSLFIPNPFKDVHALRSEKRKAGKDLVTFRSAEGQREANQPDLASYVVQNTQLRAHLAKRAIERA